MNENHRIEFKLILNDSLEKEVVAFLNSREGGIIFLGVDNKGNPKGLDKIDELQLKIKDRLKHNILPSCIGLFDIIEEEKEGKDILRIFIASGTEKPYYIKSLGMSEKGCFVRIGSATEPMPVRMIEKLFSNRTRNSLGRIKSNKQNLKFEQLKIYYEESGKALNKQFASNLGLLNEEKKFNYAAYLLSDINSNSIKVAKYKGKNRTDLVENNEYGFCSLIKATKQTLDKLDLENKTKSKITAKKRIDTRLWNPIALREAVVNAIVHNDYTREIPPKVEIFDDRIEITSSGGLPNDLTKEEYFQGFSVPRNREIMRIFKDLEMVEQLGSGVPRILEFYSEGHFQFSENFLRITFPNRWKLSTTPPSHPPSPPPSLPPSGDGFTCINKTFEQSRVSVQTQIGRQEKLC